MALDTTGLFTVLGKYVKTINIFNGYITAVETQKDEIFAVLEDEGLQDLYVSLPAQTQGFKSAVSGWIQTLIQATTGVLTDPEYVLDELAIYQYDITSVLNALYDYMVDNTITIETSVVTLGGADVALQASGAVQQDTMFFPLLFASRTLDGVNSPGNGVSAHLRYDGIESQLARDGTIYAKLTSNSVGNEAAQLHSELAVSGSYGTLPESPGVGPSIANADVINEIATNTQFTTWTGDNPTGWSVSGGSAGTDWEDYSGAGTGPLSLNTQAVKVTQQVTGLEHNRLYFAGVFAHMIVQGDTDDDVIGIKLKNLAGTVLVTQVTVALDIADDKDFGIAYTFFRLPDTVDLADIYVEVEYVTSGHATNVTNIRKVVIAPAVFYNGLGWAWWVSLNTTSQQSFAPLDHSTSIAVLNNENGVFQTFFRKAYNVQLPTDDSPSINDSLAV